MKTSLLLLTILLCSLAGAYAGEADVVNVLTEQTADGSYRFDVTVKHTDEGWDHYADKWDIVTADGTVLGTRTLYHPHVNEQPFTRSLSGVRIPEDTQEITVRAHDSVHEYGGEVMAVKLTKCAADPSIPEQ